MTEDWLGMRDAARLARYREYLDFYEGRQWLGRPLPQERRLTVNYARTLVRNAGRLLPHQAILDHVWGADYIATTDYLKVFISRLRAKLERPGGPRYIETERGLGYRFIRPREAIGATRGRDAE